jgi:hypothetical protein
MSDGTGEIIVKGGSVDLQFDAAIFPRDPNDLAKHGNPNRKITSIVIVDDEDAEVFNSGDNPSGLKWTVTVITK